MKSSRDFTFGFFPPLIMGFQGVDLDASEQTDLFEHHTESCRYDDKLMMLEAPNRQEWRSWLAKHYASSPGVWLVFKQGPYRGEIDPLRGGGSRGAVLRWVDSLIKRLDEDRYARKFTPRRPTSKWSDINRKRWMDLRAAGRLSRLASQRAPTDNTYAPRPTIPILPAYIAKALKTSRAAWDFFQQLAPTHRRNFVVWIHIAKRAETREKRIRESIALLAAGKKLGLK